MSINEYFISAADKGKNVLVVTDAGVSTLPFFDEFLKTLKSSYRSVRLFNKAVPDPDMNIVNKGVAEAKQFSPDIIIAIGGGSSIDAAKAIRVCYDIPSVNIEDLCLPFMDIGKKLVRLDPDDITTELICIPTTCGTGSETTCAAVVTDPETHVKRPIFDFNVMYADIVLLDRGLIANLPAKLVAETGFDALVHGFEAYLSIARTVETDAIALRAIKHVYSNLEKACNGDKDAKFELLKAASDAGMAISNAFVGVNHALGHQLGGKFGLSHGSSLAVVFSDVVRYNSSMPYKFQGLPTYSRWEAPARYARIAREIGLSADTKEEIIDLLIEKTEALMAKVGIATKVCEYGITKEKYMAEIESMASNGLMDMCIGANPRQVMYEDLINFYKKAYE